MSTLRLLVIVGLLVALGGCAGGVQVCPLSFYPQNCN
jgi:hypothetical protein